MRKRMYALYRQKKTNILISKSQSVSCNLLFTLRKNLSFSLAIKCIFLSWFSCKLKDIFLLKCIVNSFIMTSPFSIRFSIAKFKSTNQLIKIRKLQILKIFTSLVHFERLLIELIAPRPRIRQEHVVEFERVEGAHDPVYFGVQLLGHSEIATVDKLHQVLSQRSNRRAHIFVHSALLLDCVFLKFACKCKLCQHKLLQSQIVEKNVSILRWRKNKFVSILNTN